MKYYILFLWKDIQIAWYKFRELRYESQMVMTRSKMKALETIQSEVKK